MLDIVEGTALQALKFMQGLLKRRYTYKTNLLIQQIFALIDRRRFGL